MADISIDDVYDFLKNGDSIDVAHIQATIMSRKNKKYLNMHPYAISKYSNGYWATYLPMPDGKRKKVAKRSKKEVTDIVVDFWKEQEKRLTIADLFAKWNDGRLYEELISHRTYDRYCDAFKRHYAENHMKVITDVTIEGVLQFLKEEKKEKQLDKKAFDMLKVTVVGILETADDLNCLPFDYIRFQNELRKTVKRMKFHKEYKNDETEVFSVEEYERITTYLTENLDSKNTALLLMFVTGMRIGELAALKHSAVYESFIRVCRSETRYRGEGGRYVYEVQNHPKTASGFRDVVLPSQYSFLIKKLRTLNPFGEYIFVDENGNRYTANAIGRRLYTVCKKLGIPPRSPHKVRKTVGTMYFDAKLDKKLILNQMGWSSEAVGETHYHRDRRSLENKISIISSIPEFQR